MHDTNSMKYCSCLSTVPVVRCRHKRLTYSVVTKMQDTVHKMSKAILKLTTLLDPKGLKSSKTTGRGKMKIVSLTGN